MRGQTHPGFTPAALLAAAAALGVLAACDSQDDLAIGSETQASYGEAPVRSDTTASAAGGRSDRATAVPAASGDSVAIGRRGEGDTVRAGPAGERDGVPAGRAAQAAGAGPSAGDGTRGMQADRG